MTLLLPNRETAQLEPEETEELLKGFETSSDENSSDEDDDDENSSVDEDADAQGASSSKISARDLPSVAKDEKVANKLSSAKKSVRLLVLSARIVSLVAVCGTNEWHGLSRRARPASFSLVDCPGALRRTSLSNTSNNSAQSTDSGSPATRRCDPILMIECDATTC